MSDLSPLNANLKQYWEQALVYQLNDTALLMSRMGLPEKYVPPPWHKRIRNRFKNRIWNIRTALASKIAGYDITDGHDGWD